MRYCYSINASCFRAANQHKLPRGCNAISSTSTLPYGFLINWESGGRRTLGGNGRRAIGRDWSSFPCPKVWSRRGRRAPKAELHGNGLSSWNRGIMTSIQSSGDLVPFSPSHGKQASSFGIRPASSTLSTWWLQKVGHSPFIINGLFRSDRNIWRGGYGGAFTLIAYSRRSLHNCGSSVGNWRTAIGCGCNCIHAGSFDDDSTSAFGSTGFSFLLQQRTCPYLYSLRLLAIKRGRSSNCGGAFY